MARVIPSFVDDHTPPGEYDVFGRLANGPHDWVVLHSLDIAPWNHRRRTEIDFLVIVPDVGLACIEVKSHPEIYFDGERWYPQSIKRSPFKQAHDARFAFQRWLRETARKYGAMSMDAARALASVPVVDLCVFPRASFDLTDTLSIRTYELIDKRAFVALATGESFCAELKQRMATAIADDPQLTPLGEPLTATTIDRLVSLCLPVRRRHPEAAEEIRRHQDLIEESLRQQQKPVLQLAALNRRVVVSGGAGTGKTLIAMEVARRSANRGARVALLCYNRLVGEWLEGQSNAWQPREPNLVVDRAFRLLATLTNTPIPQNASPDYWDGPLLNRVEECLTDPDFVAAAQFDHFVIDEAQDILARPRLWNCLISLLEGGIEHGSYTLLGDFEHQVLGERAVMQAALEDVVTRGRCTRWHLSENCRNLRIVGETAVRISGFEANLYTGFLRGAGSVDDLELTEYGTAAEQDALLAKHLKELRSAGFRDGQITVLSFCQPTISAASRLQAAGHRLVANELRADRTGYASVHAFKGLDNRAIILTDVVVGGQEFHRHLFYTAMTRSTGPIRMLCHSSSMNIIRRWIADGFSS